VSKSTRRKNASQAPKVWHVFHFRERLELPDDARFCRRGPLVYSRDYVSATDDESAAYLQQIDALSRRHNGLELEGAWSRIRRATSARSRAYRGYLLTADNLPASDAEIGRTILFCEPRRATRILKALAEVGLIEQARCPIFDLSQNEVTPAKRKRTPRNKANRKSGTSGCKKSISRETTRNTEKFRAPLRAKKKRNTEKEIGKKKRNPESARVPSAALGTLKTKASQTPSRPSPPSTPEPVNPQESRAGVTQDHSCPPPHTVHREAREHIANAIKLHLRDPECQQFADEVYAVLWADSSSRPLSGPAFTEWANYAKWLWEQGPPGGRQAAIEKGLTIARHVAKNRKSYRKPGAVWRGIVAGKRTPTKARAG